MNINSVISNVAAEDLSGKEHTAVKLTSTGLALADAGERPIGTILRGAAAGFAADILLIAGVGVHFVTIGSNTAITMGDNLQIDADGKYIKQSAGASNGIAWEGSGASPSGGQIRALLFDKPTLPAVPASFADVAAVRTYLLSLVAAQIA